MATVTLDPVFTSLGKTMDRMVLYTRNDRAIARIDHAAQPQFTCSGQKA